jgi:hypothetical protein
VEPDVSAAITAKSAAPSAEWNILVIRVRNDNTVVDSTWDLTDVTLSAADGTSNPVFLGDFCVDRPNQTAWTIKNYDFTAGFKIVGTIVLGGSNFGGSAELNKIELSVMKEVACTPTPAPIVV